MLSLFFSSVVCAQLISSVLQHFNGRQQLNGNNNTTISVNSSSDQDRQRQRQQPDKVCFVDWQFSNYNSPALDLLYYIFTATDKALRDAHYDELIRFYHRTLSETIQLLGSDAEQLYSFAVMNEQLRIFGAYSYLVIPLTIDVALADPGDIVPFDEIISAPEPNGDGESEDGDKRTRKDFLNEFGNAETRHAYQKRMVDIAEDLIELGYIEEDNASNGDTDGHHVR